MIVKRMCGQYFNISIFLVMLILLNSCTSENEKSRNDLFLNFPNDGVWVGINEFGCFDFIVSPDPKELQIIQWCLHSSLDGYCFASMIPYQIENGEFHVNECFHSTTGKFLSPSDAEGNIEQALFTDLPTQVFWSAQHHISSEGYPHNGFWLGITEENLPIRLALGEKGDCFALISFSFFFPEGHHIPGMTITFEFYLFDIRFLCYVPIMDDLSFNLTDTLSNEINLNFEGNFSSDCKSSGLFRVVFNAGVYFPDGWDSGQLRWESEYGKQYEYDQSIQDHFVLLKEQRYCQ